MSTIRPFLDFYGAQNISPVAQDISDLDRHFQRRGSLYRSLGIPPLYVRDRSVIEFGPGSGHNALYTQHLGPRRYVMVDANVRGIEETRALLERVQPGKANYEIVHALIEEFESAERFDLVLAEGLVPFQMDPSAFIRHIARSAGENAVLVVTCADAPSILGEVGRRLIAYRLAGPGVTERERLARLVPVFTPHLATLGGMSRSVEDWIYDNILNPFVGRTFGIDEAIEALGDEFDVYGSSPEFIVDLRWYKQLYGAERQFNENARIAYLENMINFLDYRVTVPAHDAKLGIAIRDLSRAAYATMQAIEASGGRRSTAEAAPGIREIARHAVSSPATARALNELAAFLEDDSLRDTDAALGEFASYFGRGTQYLSFIRRS
jgi:SAM-dependent methyltransferase